MGKDISATTSLNVLYISLLVVGYFLSFTDEVPRPSPKTWALLMLVGFSTYFAEWFITKGYALADQGAGSVAVFKFLTPIFEIVWNIVSFKHFPTLLSIVGASLVVISAAVLVRVQSRQTAAEPRFCCRRG